MLYLTENLYFLSICYIIHTKVGRSGEKWVKIMFMGEFNHSLDIKGRVILPASFREQLGVNFVITKSFDKCLSIYDESNWKVLQEKLAAMPMINLAARNIRRMIVGSAATLTPDRQGRILIPAPLREFATITKEAVFIGNIDHIELWSKEAWINASDIDPDEAANELYNSGISI